MKKLITVLSAISAFALLSGCSSSGVPALPGTVPVLTTVSGVTHDFKGTYIAACHADGAAFTTESIIISGSVWAYTKADFSDVGCGTPTTSGTIVGNFAVNGTVSAITAWVDGAGAAATAPAAANGSGSLGLAEFSPLSYEVVEITGSFVGSLAISDVVSLFYVVDDTGAKAILYRDAGYVPTNATINASTFAPFIQL